MQIDCIVPFSHTVEPYGYCLCVCVCVLEDDFSRVYMEFPHLKPPQHVSTQHYLPKLSFHLYYFTSLLKPGDFTEEGTAVHLAAFKIRNQK